MGKRQEPGAENPLRHGHMTDAVLGQEGSHSSTVEQLSLPNFIQLHSMENDSELETLPPETAQKSTLKR